MTQIIKTGQPQFKQFAAEIKEVGDREFNFTISTADVDRDGDTIAINGWDLRAFKRNPVVLWAHSHSQPPLGQATRVWTEDDKLRATVRFLDEGTSPFADMIHAMIKQRALRATSVGFIPKEWKYREDGDPRGRGVDFLKQELLEFSCVPVPANAAALIGAAKRFGITAVPGLTLQNHRSPSPAILNLRPDDIVLEIVDDDEPPVLRDYDPEALADREAWDSGYRAGLRTQRTRAPARTQAHIQARPRAPTREPLRIDVDPSQVQQLVRDSVTSTLQDVLAAEIGAGIRRITGRLD